MTLTSAIYTTMKAAIIALCTPRGIKRYAIAVHAVVQWRSLGTYICLTSKVKQEVSAVVL